MRSGPYRRNIRLRRESVLGMQRITLPVVGLVALAGLADLGGAHTLAFYTLVAAVPAAAAAALVALDRALTADGRRPLRRAWLQATVLVLVLLSAAVRAPVREENSVPQLATSALVACLLLLALQIGVNWLPAFRRSRATHPALDA